MNSKRLFMILVALLVLINGGGVALLLAGNKYLDKQNAKLTDLKVQTDTLDSVQRSLVKAKKDVETYSSLAQVVATVVPQEKDQAKTVREIVQLASDSGVAINSINFPSSTLGAAAAAGAGTAPVIPGSNTQTQAVEGISNVERLEITITSGATVPYDNFILFLQKLEQNRRTAQVSSINVTPDTNNPKYVQFSLVLNVYLKKAGA